MIRNEFSPLISLITPLEVLVASFSMLGSLGPLWEGLRSFPRVQNNFLINDSLVSFVLVMINIFVFFCYFFR